jgi:outer membrane immunogenic protein
MKRSLSGGVLLCAALMTVSATAADFGAPLYRAPVVAAPFAWNGFYLGIQSGAGWGATDLNTTSASVIFPPEASGTVPTNFQSASYPLNGWHGGGTIGFNWQTGPVVLGVEADVSGANIEGRGDCTSAVGFGSVLNTNSSCHTSMSWLATFTGRAGFAVEHALWYVKGGVALAHFNHDITSGSAILEIVKPADSGAAASASETRTGGAFGVGVEYAFWSNWSAKLEYDYMDFGTRSLTFAQTFVLTGAVGPTASFINTMDLREQVHVIRAGLNYRFDWAR